VNAQCLVEERTQNRSNLIQCDATAESTVRNKNVFPPSTRMDKYKHSANPSICDGEEFAEEKFSVEVVEGEEGSGDVVDGGEEER
jgi:hypothetical protein